jgi:ferredoxin--NADP+ reductase
MTRDPAVLATTDLAPGPLARLRGSAVREVVVLGRRGPTQAAFTVPELIGLAGLGDIDVVVEADPASLTGDDRRSRLLAELAARRPSADPARRRIVLRFATSPTEILGTGGQVTGVRVVANRLDTDEHGEVRAVGTGRTEVIEAGLVVRAVGHRATPVAGLPFDTATHTVPHTAGRVSPGLYVVGWIKRGPVGFIGTNKTCAQETVDSILDDLDAGLPRPSGTATSVTELVRSRVPGVVDGRGWRRIDTEERERGERLGRPRAKITDTAEQRRIALGSTRGRLPRAAATLSKAALL